MADVTMIVSALTDVGRARTTNEDAFAVTDLASGRQLEAAGHDLEVDVEEQGVLLALSDGMGGHQAGEVASALVLETLQVAMQGTPPGAIHEQLEEAVQRANRSVWSAAQTQNRRGMGATLTAIFVRGGGKRYSWHIGAAPLHEVANREKKMPRSYISRDGFNITDEARAYLAPLIQGEAYPEYRKGMPQYVRLKNVVVPKKLQTQFKL